MEDKIFNELLQSVDQAKSIMSGNLKPSRTFYIEEPNAKEIRVKLKLTQNEFSNLLNISINTLRNWEQGRRTPQGTARVLLNVVNTHPEALMHL